MRRVAALAGVIASTAFILVLASVLRSAGTAPTQERSQVRPHLAMGRPVTSVAKFSVLKRATPARVAVFPPRVMSRLQMMASERVPDIGDGKPSALGVALLRDGTKVAVVSVGDSICAFISSGIGGFCGRRQRAAAMQAFTARPVGCYAYRVLVLVPDGNQRISVDVHADGSRDAVVQVRRNVLEIVAQPVRTVLTSTDSMGHSLRLRLPLDQYASWNGGCR